jgi:predicted transcriptional regulator
MDIYAEILEALKRKGLTRITRISYAVGLPVDRTKNYLKGLSSFGLVVVQTSEESGYSITRRGMEFLDAYWKLKGFLDFIGGEDAQKSTP